MINEANIGIEGESLFGNPGDAGIYTYTLLKYLSIIEKKDRFHILYSKFPVFKKNRIDFMAHNIKHRFMFLPEFFFRSLDIYHNTSASVHEGKVQCKKVITIHDLAGHCIDELRDNPDYRDFAYNISHTIQSYSAVIAPSANSKRDIIKHLGIPEKAIHVIFDGVREEFSPAPKFEIELVKSRYAIKRPYMLLMGPIEEKKNVKRILEAYAMLKYESPPDLVITGEIKWLKESLASTIKRLGIENNVHYIGFIPQKHLRAVLTGAELFLWPTLGEGCSIAMLEAMACGCPVISSELASNPDIMGDCGLLVDPFDEEDIAAAIRKLLLKDEMRKAFGKMGIERAKLFPARKMASETLKLYKSLLPKSLKISDNKDEDDIEA